MDKFSGRSASIIRRATCRRFSNGGDDAVKYDFGIDYTVLRYSRYFVGAVDIGMGTDGYGEITACRVTSIPSVSTFYMIIHLLEWSIGWNNGWIFEC